MSPEGPKDKQDTQQTSRPFMRGINFWIFLIVIAIVMTWLWSSFLNPGRSEISITYLQKLIEGQDYSGQPLRDEEGNALKTNIEEITLQGKKAYGTFKVRPPAKPDSSAGTGGSGDQEELLQEQFVVTIGPTDGPDYEAVTAALKENDVDYSIKEESNWAAFYTMVFVFFTIGIVVLMFISMRRAQNQMLGGGGFLSNFSRSPAKQYEASDERIMFKDVAGLESVKGDLNEIVDFLSDPDKFQKLGGRVPKGVLLVGPPGTGKTLLARAVAGEANVPYFSVNGSEFIQMFVGVGASRVRDLFNTAKSQAPAIIFIDEIDAVGRQRGAGLGGGHDEREQTLNQILGEMDGFTKNDSVIVLAATNRPDVLDPALLRPGRFDRHVNVTRPTMTGRLAIFKVHVRDVPLAEDVDLKSLAQATAGMTGADIQNMVNEAALWAARNNKSKVEMEDFYYAHDKVLMGAKREEVLSDIEKKRTAYHEAGHTLSSWFLEGAYPVHKVTIIPRSQSLGVTQMVPDEDRMNVSEKEVKEQLIVLLSGRGAEKLIYDEFTVGAENDLERATSLARRMVTHWGMSDRLGPVSYKVTDEDPFLGREIHQNRQFSEHTMEIIDEEVAKFLVDASQKSLNLLNDRRDLLDLLANKLIEEEELDRKQLTELLGPSVHDRKEDEQKKAQEKKKEQSEESESEAKSEVAEEGSAEAGSTDDSSTEDSSPDDSSAEGSSAEGNGQSGAEGDSITTANRGSQTDSNGNSQTQPNSQSTSTTHSNSDPTSDSNPGSTSRSKSESNSEPSSDSEKVGSSENPVGDDRTDS